MAGREQYYTVCLVRLLYFSTQYSLGWVSFVYYCPSSCVVDLTKLLIARELLEYSGGARGCKVVRSQPPAESGTLTRLTKLFQRYANYNYHDQPKWL